MYLLLYREVSQFLLLTHVVLTEQLFPSFDVAELSMKFQHYGINGRALKLLLDFISDRVQYVVNEGEDKVRRVPYHNRCFALSSLSNPVYSFLLYDLPHAIEKTDNLRV